MKMAFGYLVLLLVFTGYVYGEQPVKDPLVDEVNGVYLPVRCLNDKKIVLDHQYLFSWGWSWVNAGCVIITYSSDIRFIQIPDQNKCQITEISRKKKNVIELSLHKKWPDVPLGLSGKILLKNIGNGEVVFELPADDIDETEIYREINGLGSLDEKSELIRYVKIDGPGAKYHIDAKHSYE